MGRAYRGPYARPLSYNVPYATAAVWGTGIDPVHSYYGEGPPVRVYGRQDALGSSPVQEGHTSRSRDYQNPADSSGTNAPEELTWGYYVDYGPDSFGGGADSAISHGDVGPPTYQDMDDRPPWNVDTPSNKLRSTASTMVPWNVSGAVMRALRTGSHRFRMTSGIVEHGAGAYQPISAEPSISNPTETVSEGWLNKVTSFVSDSEPSADQQIFVQTSMRQRYLSKDNGRAQLRETDDARTSIRSRVMPMVEKVYSTGERSYDMFPYQADVIARPFRFRTASTGRQEWLEPNEYRPITPVQRTPPADPAAGVPEVSSPDYGYTGEDTMYYG